MIPRFVFREVGTDVVKTMRKFMKESIVQGLGKVTAMRWE
jgi:hypothetical protein